MKKLLMKIIACLTLIAALPASASSDFRVTLLGTGSPNPSAQRSGPATLVEAGGVRILIDAGRGTSVRLWQLGIPLSKVDVLLLTHFHSDHTVGIPDLWLTGWVDTPYGRRKTPFQVVGPVGTNHLMSGLQQAYADDIRVRLEDEKNPAEGVQVNATEFKTEGVVYRKDGVVVTAFEVDHGDAIKPAYGYRVDYKGKSAVISGDTRFSENLIKHAQHVDLLVHEVATVHPGALKANPGFKRIFEHHTSPQQAGIVFSRTKPKLAAYTHLVFLPDPRFPVQTADDVIRQTRETYDGPLQVGADLMSFDIGEEVKVKSSIPQ